MSATASTAPLTSTIQARLRGRVALVTGAASPRGLSAGIARALASRGVTVACRDLLDTTETAAGLPQPDTGIALMTGAQLNLSGGEDLF